MSTPKFVKYLTDLSSKLIGIENKLEILKKQLSKLNASLPSNVYIPFVNEQIRSYIVLNIPVKETKVFVTKDKAPYLIAVELFDPLEIAYDPEMNKVSLHSDKGYLPAPQLPMEGSLVTKSSKKTSEELYRRELEKNLIAKFSGKQKKLKRSQYITIEKAKAQRVYKNLVKDSKFKYQPKVKTSINYEDRASFLSNPDPLEEDKFLCIETESRKSQKAIERLTKENEVNPLMSVGSSRER